jgi:hypothetical protein
MKDIIHILQKKIIIFKESQNTHIGHDTHDQVLLPFSPLSVFDHNSGYIIYDDREDQDEDIYRDKSHVENATGYQQMDPSVFIRQ